MSLVNACYLDKQKRSKEKKDDVPAGLEGLDNDEEAKTYDLIVARDNGRIEIYCYTMDSPFPLMCFEH